MQHYYAMHCKIDAFCYFWHQTCPIVPKNIVRMHSGTWSTLIQICQYFIMSTFLPICHAAWSWHALHDNDAFCYFWHQKCPMVSKHTKSIVRMHSGAWSTLIQIFQYFVFLTYLPICHAAWSCHALHDNDSFLYFWHQTFPIVPKNTKSIIRMHSGPWSTLI